MWLWLFIWFDKIKFGELFGVNFGEWIFLYFYLIDKLINSVSKLYFSIAI
jgi:hypothetical protein